jgi:hypothetical protein
MHTGLAELGQKELTVDEIQKVAVIGELNISEIKLLFSAIASVLCSTILSVFIFSSVCIVCASSVWVSGVAARSYYVKVCDVKSIVIRLRAFAATSS